jgi:SAM-dependent methyltransferase
MNNKILKCIEEKLQETFNIDKYQYIKEKIKTGAKFDDLPWTPARKQKFIQKLESTFGVPIELDGTIGDLVERTDVRYLNWFFGEIWKPRTEQYQWTGYRIAEEICRANPKRVLDVGCGYNPFKGRIPNLVGIDPYNNCADFMIDILDYHVEPASFDHIIALGSINFNSREDIEERFAATVDLLAPGGHLWMRCNPGHSHKNGPWVEIFPWSFDVAYELAKKYGLTLETLKQDKDRLFFLFVKH